MMSEITPFIPAHRPTEVLYRRAPTQLPPIEKSDIIKRDKSPIKKTTIDPIKKRQEEKLIPENRNQKRLSLPKHLPPTGNNKRRPIRFTDQPIVQQESKTDDKLIMDVIREELTEKPLNPNEELVIVEQ